MSVNVTVSNGVHVPGGFHMFSGLLVPSTLWYWWILPWLPIQTVLVMFLFWNLRELFHIIIFRCILHTCIYVGVRVFQCDIHGDVALLKVVILYIFVCERYMLTVINNLHAHVYTICLLKN